MSTILSDGDIFQIATILASDATVVRKKDIIYGSLCLPLAELEDLKKRVFIDNSGAHGFFCGTLVKYQSRNGTVQNIIARLIELNLNHAAGQLQTAYNN